VVWNKCDLAAPDAGATALGARPISAKHGAGVEELAGEIARRVAGDADGEALLAAVRQRDLVARARDHLAAAQAVAQTGRDHELAAEELRQAATALSELVGETSAEEVLDVIFARFCVGK
jgi:tRNA modification GTPase